MSTALDSLITDISQHVVGCPDPTISTAIVDTLIELCTKSNAWTQESVSTTYPANTVSLAIPVVGGGLVNNIKDVYVDGVEVFVKSQYELSIMFQNWKSVKGTPTHYFNDNGNLRLVPIPAVDVSVQLGLTLKPARSETVVDDWFYNKYWETILHGALYRLMIVPKRTWTDMATGAYHKSEFLIGVDNAKIDVLKSNTEMSNKVNSRRFGQS